MNLKLVFRIFGGLSIINALAFILFTESIVSAAGGLAVTADTITIAQAVGVWNLFVGIVSWRTPDIAGDSLNAFGQLFAIGLLIPVIGISYHILTGKAGGAPAFGNLGINVLLAALFFMYSKK